MDFASLSDRVLEIARWVSIVSVGLVLLLALQIVAMRLLREARERRRRRFLARWEPLLLSHLDGDPVPLPAVRPADVGTLLHLWNRFHELLCGDETARLDRFLHASGVVPRTRAMLRRGGTRNRLLATQVLGNLRDRESWETLAGIARGSHPYLSICATRSLVRIDVERAVPLIVPLIARRDDWPFAKVAELLTTGGSLSFSGPLARETRTASGEGRVRLLRLLEGAREQDALPVARELFDGSEEPEVLAACARLFGRFASPLDLNRVRGLVDHPEAYVRLHGAGALGAMGLAEDEPGLLRLASDPDWWVRYRAASALAGLPSVDRDRLRSLRERAADPFARDILTQVMAEKVSA